MTSSGSDCGRMVIYDTVLKGCWDLREDSLGRRKMRCGERRGGRRAT